MRPPSTARAGEPSDAAPADTSPTSEPGVDTVPVPPLAAAVTDGPPPARPAAPTVARPPLRRRVRPGLAARRRRRCRRPVRVEPAVRGAGPARRPRRQHGARRAHPRAGAGGARERLSFARHRADHAHRPGRADDDAQLRRCRPRPERLGAGRRGIRGRPRGRAPREPPRRTPSRDPRHDPRPRRRLRPRQAGGRRRHPRHDDRPDPCGRLRVGRRRRGVQRSPLRRKAARSTRRRC